MNTIANLPLINKFRSKSSTEKPVKEKTTVVEKTEQKPAKKEKITTVEKEEREPRKFFAGSKKSKTTKKETTVVEGKPQLNGVGHSHITSLERCEKEIENTVKQHQQSKQDTLDRKMQIYKTMIEEIDKSSDTQKFQNEIDNLKQHRLNLIKNGCPMFAQTLPPIMENPVQTLGTPTQPLETPASVPLEMERPRDGARKTTAETFDAMTVPLDFNDTAVQYIDPKEMKRRDDLEVHHQNPPVSH